MSVDPTTVDRWTVDDWLGRIESALRLEPTGEGLRPGPEDPLLGIRQILDLPISSEARINHLAAVLRLISRLAEERTQDAARRNLEEVLDHVAVTATDLERRRAERTAVADLLCELAQAGDELAAPGVAALAALDLPETSAFWWKMVATGADPLLAAEVLAVRRERHTPDALASAAEHAAQRRGARRELAALFKGIAEEVGWAKINQWAEMAFASSGRRLILDALEDAGGEPPSRRTDDAPRCSTRTGTW